MVLDNNKLILEVFVFEMYFILNYWYKVGSTYLVIKLFFSDIWCFIDADFLK